MKSIQLIYPNLSITLNNLKYIKIGIERPYNRHIEEDDATFPLEATIMINNIRYIITDKDILEFGNIHHLSNPTTILAENLTNKYLIIDIAYKTAD